MGKVPATTVTLASITVLESPGDQAFSHPKWEMLISVPAKGKLLCQLPGHGINAQ